MDTFTSSSNAGISRELVSRLPRHYAAWAAGFVAIGCLVAFLLPTFVHPQRMHDDAGQHLWWGQRAWGGEPTASSEVAQYFASPAAAPFGWHWLVRGLASLGDLQRMAEVANFIVVGLTAWLLFLLCRKAGQRLGKRPATWAGLAGVTVFGISQVLGVILFEDILLQRGFALGLACLVLLGLLSRNLHLVGLGFVLTALLYPVLIAILGLIAIVNELWRLAVDRKMPRGWITCTLGGCFALSWVLLVRDVPDAYLPMVTMDDARSMPIFGPDGRSSMFGLPLVERLTIHSRTGIGFDLVRLAVGLATVLLAVALIGGVRRVPSLLWITLLCSVGLWGLSFAVMFDLYLPNRHSRTTLPIVWLLFLGLGTAGLVRRLRIWGRQRHEWGVAVRRRWALASSTLVVVGAGLVALPEFREDIVRFERGYETRLMAYLRQLPPEAVLAGWHDDLDVITMRTGRAGLISRESTQAYYLGYYRDIALPRVEAMLDAFYSPDWSVIDRLADDYGVRVFIYRNWRARELPDEEPFKSIAARHYQALGQDADDPRFTAREPAMYRPPLDRVLFMSGDLYVIRVGSDTTGLPSATVDPEEVARVNEERRILTFDPAMLLPPPLRSQNVAGD